jgi:hypothetical protein
VTPPVHSLPDVVVIGVGSPAHVDAGAYAVALDDGLGTFDAAHSYALVLGSIVDREILSDGDRAHFAAALGVPDRDWQCDRYADSPEVAFAHAFARLACIGPWRDEYWRGAYWAPEDEDRILSTCREVISEADGRRSLAARA